MDYLVDVSLHYLFMVLIGTMKHRLSLVEALAAIQPLDRGEQLSADGSVRGTLAIVEVDGAVWHVDGRAG